MFGFYHEITCPDHRAIRNYLWFDHFHDSTVHHIAFNDKKGLLLYLNIKNEPIFVHW